MSEKSGRKHPGFTCPPFSAEYYGAIADGIADDDNIDGPGNDLTAALYYYKAVKAGRKEQSGK